MLTLTLRRFSLPDFEALLVDITAGAAAAQTSEILLFKYLEDGGEITNAMCIAMKTSVTRGGMSVKAAKDLLGRTPSSYKAPSWGVPLA